jgi:hypothetical protein
MTQVIENKEVHAVAALLMTPSPLMSYTLKVHVSFSCCVPWSSVDRDTSMSSNRNYLLLLLTSSLSFLFPEMFNYWYVSSLSTVIIYCSSLGSCRVCSPKNVELLVRFVPVISFPSIRHLGSPYLHQLILFG